MDVASRVDVGGEETLRTWRESPQPWAEILVLPLAICMTLGEHFTWSSGFLFGTMGKK